MRHIQSWSAWRVSVTAFVAASLLTGTCLVVGGLAANAAENDGGAAGDIQVSDLPKGAPPPAEELPPGADPDDVEVDSNPSFAHVSRTPVDAATVSRCTSKELQETDLCALVLAKAEGSLPPGDYSQAEFDAAVGADR